ncbi:hypothetical protein K4K52_008797 [Colletotrichum sp. SAR 10_76]|nr:hypothetical protein K4K52_008797 [Colletotrichum sp. SAR 10_76]
MAAQPEFSRKWSWRTDLRAYVDGLGDARQPSQILTFSGHENHKTVRSALIERLRNGTAQGTTNLPTSQELGEGNSRKARRGLWVGWHLPLEVAAESSQAIQGLSIKKLIEKEASNEQLEAVTVSQSSPTALKAIVSMDTRKRLQYYALAEPDPRNGICKAFQLKGGTTGVYFFPEFRDPDDNLIDANKRCRAWAASIMEAAGKKEDDNDEDDASDQDDEHDDNGDDNKGKENKPAKQKSGEGKGKSKIKTGLSMSDKGKSAVAGGGVGAASSFGTQTQNDLWNASASTFPPSGASRITELKARLADLRLKMSPKLYNEIRVEMEGLTKVKFPPFPDLAYLWSFICKRRLNLRRARLAVDEFFRLYSHLNRQSLTKLNHFLVHAASVVLRSDTEGIVTLSLDTVKDFLVTLAYICDARYADEAEVKTKVFLAFEMVREQPDAFPQSNETTHQDRIRTFLTDAIDNMERQLVVHVENSRLAASLGAGQHTTGAAIVDRWVKRLREPSSGRMQEPPRPSKRLRQLVVDEDEDESLPEAELDGPGSNASSNGESLAAAGSTGDSAGTPSHQHAEGENLGSSSRPAPDDFHDASSHIAEPSTVEVKPSGSGTPPGTPPGTPNSDSHLSDPESLVTGPGSPKDSDSLAVLQLFNELEN